MANLAEGSMTKDINGLPSLVATPSRNGGRPETRGAWLIGAIPVLLAIAWLASTTGSYTPGSSIGYLLGVTGGTMMLLLFLYPLRKRVPLMRGWGHTKHWFALHMLLGVLGPLFILAHSTFQVRSINAAVALGSMLLVAASGVIGRYIYTRLHHGLYGERARARELQLQFSERLLQLAPLVQQLPRVKEMLDSFEAQALRPRPHRLAQIWAFLTFSIRARLTRARCEQLLRRAHRGLHGREAHVSFAREHALLSEYFSSLQRAAQFSTWERLFSWWHVLHVPLVYMLVLTAIAHVVAVHIY
jgi:hypothetical protein